MIIPIRRPTKIPEAILQLQQQLDQWRSAQKGRAKLPESFWQAAVDLAKQYGVFRTAQPLRLDYTRLKQRLSGAVPRRKASRPREHRSYSRGTVCWTARRALGEWIGHEPWQPGRHNGQSRCHQRPG